MLKQLTLISVISLASLPFSSHAELLIDGGSANSGSSSLFSATDYYQQVYDGNLFSEGITITDISYFVGNSTNDWADDNAWEMTLSVGDYTVNNLSGDFYQNIGDNFSVFSTASFANNLNVHDKITFSGSYNLTLAPEQDLLVSIRALGGTGGASLIYDSFSRGEFSAAHSGVNNANAEPNKMFSSNNLGLVTSFNYEISAPQNAQVPIPASMSLFAFFSVFLARKRTRKLS